MSISFDVPDAMSNKEVKALCEAHNDLYSEERLREVGRSRPARRGYRADCRSRNTIGQGLSGGKASRS